MPVLQVIATGPRAGKTAVAAGLARGLAGHGQTVQLLRIGSSGAATADAAAFGGYLFASSPGTPISRSAVQPPAGATAIIEADGGEPPLEAPAVLVVRGSPDAQDEALAGSLGAKLIGTVATNVPPGQVDAIGRALVETGYHPLAVVPEDRRLAAPSVADIRHALAADVLYEGEDLGQSVQDVLVAPVYTDGAKMHFRSFAGSKAVLTPSYKTDLLLAAIEAEADCVIVTGGHQPSHYVIDRVQGQPTTLLLAQQQTPAAVSALSEVWGASAFAGEAKVGAMFELLDARLDWAGLVKKLQ